GERAREKEPRLLFERFEEAVVEIIVNIRIDDDLTEAAEVQPLRGEVVDERARRARIGQHAPRLLFEDRGIGKLPALGRVEQPLVGDAVPQEEREARRELEIAQAIRRSTR